MRVLENYLTFYYFILSFKNKNEIAIPICFSNFIILYLYVIFFNSKTNMLMKSLVHPLMLYFD